MRARSTGGSGQPLCTSCDHWNGGTWKNCRWDNTHIALMDRPLCYCAGYKKQEHGDAKKGR